MTNHAWSDDQIAAVSENIKSGLLSPQLMPVGLESDEGSSKLGLEGQLFLVRGSNNLQSQYRADFDHGANGVAGRAAEWVELFRSRDAGCRERGTKYIQLIIPEKLTTLRHLAPIPVTGRTPLLTEIENIIGREDFYVSGFAALEGWDQEYPPFATGDSHLSASGAQRVFADLADRIAPGIIPAVEAIKMDDVEYRKGDLTARFYGLPIYSEVRQPSVAQMRHIADHITQAERYFPKGRVVGRRFRSQNSVAASPLTVLVFGNSFFSAGDIPGELMWWGKHFFGDIRVIWQPNFDWAIVDEMRPDVVIGQTIERFLVELPES